MRKSAGLFWAVLAALGLWYFFQTYKIEGLDQVRIVRRSANEPAARPAGYDSAGGAAPGPGLARQSVRIATFNIQVFGDTKAGKPRVMDLLAQIVREFDVVAVQEIRSKSEDLLPRFVERVNATGRRYDYVIGPRLGRTSSKEQYAFVFDTETVEIDRAQLYTVDDPDDLLHREPLVGWFRVRGPPPEAAFTFTLVNIHTDPDETGIELNVLDDVYRAVRDDGRGEDDVILLGDLNVDDRGLGELGRLPGMQWVVSGTPTNTRRTRQYDNILFQLPATK